MLTVNEQNRARFEKALATVSARYDEKWKGPASELGSARYHTTLSYTTVHPTRDAFGYAAALLASGREADRLRAIEVLDNVVRLQDQEPSNATFGIWSWYMEEPLEKMSPPDWNWANFCGKEILQVLNHHAERLPADLVERLRMALRCACLSIFRRNMGCYYTNICIMGAYVTLAAGQFMNWPDMFAYGKSIFHKFYDTTRANSNTFAEYNSSTYTVVAIEDLTRIFNEISDPEVHVWAEAMLDVGWGTAAQYFHAPTRQWCGPNSRSYQWLATPRTLSFLQLGLEDTVKLVDEADFDYDLGWAYIDLKCPEKYRSAFKTCEPHDVDLTFYTADGGLESSREHATAHLCNEYALGSWRNAITWNQRRNLLAYWGGEHTRFLGATVLHDLYDFSSGVLAVAQRGGDALATMSLYTDGGDTHCNLDMVKDATIRAYDLRLRFEFGGALATPPRVTDDEAVLDDAGVSIRLKLLGASCDGKPLHFELSDSDADAALQDAHGTLHRRYDTSLEKRYNVDVVLYNGPEREIKLDELRDAYAAVCLSMEGHTPEDATLRVEDGTLHASARLNGTEFEIASPAAPIARKGWSASVETR